MRLSGSLSVWSTVAMASTLISLTVAQDTPSPESPTSTPTFTPTPTVATTPAPAPGQQGSGTVLPVSKTWPAASAPTYPVTPRDNRTSPSFPDSEYVKLLDYSLLFYEAQRSGKLPSDQRVTWRRDSVLGDGRDAGVDLSGYAVLRVNTHMITLQGYFDAGDYLKFIFPLTFAMSEICWGGIEFFEGYQLGDEVKYLDKTVRWGMDWLIKAHPNNDTLFVQVGTDGIDNNYWGPDITIPLPRATFQVSRSKPGTDVVASAAAAFGSCSILYRDKLKDTAYADILQTHASSLFQLAETAFPQQVYTTVVPAARCCYASTGYMDELAWGAAWMYTMTKDASYVVKAGRYVDQLIAGNAGTFPVTWDNKLGLVYVLMASSTQGSPNDNKKWQELAVKYADSTTSASKPCQYTKGGLYYCPGDSNDASSAVAANAAFAMHLMANQLDRKGGSEETSSGYRQFALSQIEYLLGDNPLKTPYVVGVHHNSPANPHSAPASGGTNDQNIDDYPSQMLYTIYGALVGGPDTNDRYEDVRSNWEQNEVALDYNAPFAGLMAYQVMVTNQSPPYVTILPGRPDLPPILNGMEIWQIILIVIGSIFVAIGICAAVCYRKRDQIRAWSAARKNKGKGRNKAKHPLSVNKRGNMTSELNKENELEHGGRPQEEQELTQTHYDHTQDERIVHGLAVPPPPPPPLRPSQAEHNLASTDQIRRPVPPPPLPARHDDDPILLQQARRS
ncbi:hypothetical protein BG004_006305 [Podila humilis]|nr:hypothetical protein BG004_006305 [Podila humilis]